MEITWLGHGTFQFVLPSGEHILMDPWTEGNPKYPDGYTIQKIGVIRVTMTHAIHSCGILDDGKIIYGGEAAGYVLRFDDNRTLYFAGDTNVFSDMEVIEQLYHPALGFLPV